MLLSKMRGLILKATCRSINQIWSEFTSKTTQTSQTNIPRDRLVKIIYSMLVASQIHVSTFWACKNRAERTMIVRNRKNGVSRGFLCPEQTEYFYKDLFDLK